EEVRAPVGTETDRRRLRDLAHEHCPRPGRRHRRALDVLDCVHVVEAERPDFQTTCSAGKRSINRGCLVALVPQTVSLGIRDLVAYVRLPAVNRLDELRLAEVARKQGVKAGTRQMNLPRIGRYARSGGLEHCAVADGAVTDADDSGLELKLI